MTSLLLRADASASIGAGHAVRCLAFAEHAVALGWQVAFAGTAPDWVCAELHALDVPVLAPGPPDALDADVVLVDHYGIGPVRTRGVLVSVEDGAFGRRRADVVVDCGLATEPRPDDGSPVLLRGPRYAPLRASVRSRRNTGGGGIVVVLGGTAPVGPLRTLASAAVTTGRPVRVVTAAPLAVPGAVVDPPRPDLPELLAGADLVVSAAGVTVLELCCLGVPMALVTLADNQRPGYRAAIGHGAAVGLDGLAEPEVGAVLRDLVADDARRAALAAAASALVDGHGAARVLAAATG